MSSLTSVEQQGIKDLLQFYNDDPALTFDLAKVVCKNLITPQTVAEAVDLILLHSSSVNSILNRKAITKSTLFKYLNAHRVPVNVELSKVVLIDKLVAHWAERFQPSNHLGREDTITLPPDTETYIISRQQTRKDIGAHSSTPQSVVDDTDQREQFPIHRMSRQFTGWFFGQLNTAELSAEDFFCDAHCDIDMLDSAAAATDAHNGGSSSAHHETADGAEACAGVLLALRERYAFYFNANECHAGCQGRVDAHGLVLVLSCGTLHVQQRFVGCWECAFGLVRDPFTDNNWKVKHMKLRLRSVAATAAVTTDVVPQLVECEMLQSMLALPASEMDLA